MTEDSFTERMDVLNAPLAEDTLPVRIFIWNIINSSQMYAYL